MSRILVNIREIHINLLMRIYLIGFMGSGKSTAGKKLANKLALRFFDLDELIEQESSMPVGAYFEKYGETEFRSLERVILHKTFALDNVLIATGGGTPCFYDNINEINKNGISVYLKADIPLIISRLKSEKNKRPLIKDKSDDELGEYLSNLLKQREQFYSLANIIVNAINLNINKLSENINLFAKG